MTKKISSNKCSDKSISRTAFKSLLSLALISFLLFVLSSCYAPSPLYGTWADFAGNKVTFMEDASYSATITLNGNAENEDGTYNVLKNVMVFTRASGTVMETEWDIRGNLMYLNWIDADNRYRALTLMKISN